MELAADLRAGFADEVRIGDRPIVIGAPLVDFKSKEESKRYSTWVGVTSRDQMLYSLRDVFKKNISVEGESTVYIFNHLAAQVL